MKNANRMLPLLSLLIFALIILAACSTSAISNGDLNETEEALQLQVDVSELEAGMMNIPTISMMNETTGWSVYNQAIYRTVDGGKTWLDVSPTGIKTSTEYVYLHNENAVWIALNQGTHWEIYSTKDGGGSWHKSEEIGIKGVFAKFHFINEKEGWLMITKNPGLDFSEVVLLKTENGGNSWTVVTDKTADYQENTLPHSGNKTGIAFRSSKDGWIVGNKSSELAPWMYVTHDGGFTWQMQHVPIPNNENYQGIWTETPNFFTSNDGILFAQTYSAEQSLSHFYRTNDGGESWEEVSTVNDGNGYLIHDFISSEIGWMTDGEFLYKTDDGLQNWQKQFDVKDFVTDDVDRLIVALDFVTEEKGWLIIQIEGHGYLLCHTIDGGSSWQLTKPTLIQ